MYVVLSMLTNTSNGETNKKILQMSCLVGGQVLPPQLLLQSRCWLVVLWGMETWLSNQLHPQKQTWNLKMDPWKRRFLLVSPSFPGSMFVLGSVYKMFLKISSDLVVQLLISGHWNCALRASKDPCANLRAKMPSALSVFLRHQAHIYM